MVAQFLVMLVITVAVRMNFFLPVVPLSVAVVLVEQQARQVALLQPQRVLRAVLLPLLRVSAVVAVVSFLVSVAQSAMQPAMSSLVSVTVGTTATVDNWR
jgi:hypothetical protein